MFLYLTNNDDKVGLLPRTAVLKRFNRAKHSLAFVVQLTRREFVVFIHGDRAPLLILLCRQAHNDDDTDTRAVG